MIPRQHQIDGAAWALSTIRSNGLAYLAWKERTGKTLTALLTVEHSEAKSCLVITKKKAMDGWFLALRDWEHTKRFNVINYESVHKMDPLLYDFIILDEAHHAISSIGKPSITWRKVRHFTSGKPILYLSATPYTEHIGLIYHQLKLSDWSPLKHKNFYDFYREFGIPNMIRTPYGLQDSRTKYRTEYVLAKILHLFNFKTRKDVGMEVEPTVRVTEVPILPATKQRMLAWRKDKIITIGDNEIMGDSDAKLRTVHYQMEGGTIKVNSSTSLFLPETEKIDYIRSHYNLGEIAIMAHFIAERELLSSVFPSVPILSSDGDAEGVDLSHIKKLIIYSMSFKTSKHMQRVARQANHNRTHPIVVDILVMGKPGIGKAVYDSVAVKEENFVKASYERVLK